MSGVLADSNNLPRAVVAVKPLSGSLPSSLVAVDSPAMKFAFQLAAEVFPGSVAEVEVVADPDEPERIWYSLNIRWTGETGKSLELDLIWHRRFEAAYPEVSTQFCLATVSA